LNDIDYELARAKMVKEQLIKRGIRDKRVLQVMLRLPRHLFLDRGLGAQAYSDHAFPIGYSQTMSQPFMVAYLAECLELAGGEKVLEIGTGSGYQAAVLSELAGEVYTVERIPQLTLKAKTALDSLGIRNVFLRSGDGAEGWPEMAPFDRILLTAAAEGVPRKLFRQLKEGGIFLGPVAAGAGKQEIVKLVKHGDDLDLQRLRPCSFVPLIRKDQVVEGGIIRD
jgi:protein-L-isoaspartate(D-aspartate) O-methyltransferase